VKSGPATLIPLLASVIPYGRWTSYGDLARIAGCVPLGVTRHMRNADGMTPWRVIRADGSTATGFTFTVNGQEFTPREALEREGVPFDHRGRADKSLHITGYELLQLIDASE
jgi:alkylated DNA nucleotide flippase Atl1